MTQTALKACYERSLSAVWFILLRTTALICDCETVLDSSKGLGRISGLGTGRSEDLDGGDGAGAGPTCFTVLPALRLPPPRETGIGFSSTTGKTACGSDSVGFGSSIA